MGLLCFFVRKEKDKGIKRYAEGVVEGKGKKGKGKEKEGRER